MSMASGEISSLERNLLDFSRPECFELGTSWNCLPSNNCEEGWTCVPANAVDGVSWIGTYCYDPACVSTTPPPDDDIIERGSDDKDAYDAVTDVTHPLSP